MPDVEEASSAVEDYIEIGTLPGGCRLVQQTGSHQVFVRKDLAVYNRDVYLYLKDHPVQGIPRIIDMAQENGKLVVIEEYICGYSLREWIDHGWLTSEAQVVNFILQLCCIADRLHRCSPQIIHRDIKPSNILIMHDGLVRLLDLNAAKQFHPYQQKDTTLLGTEGYAAPEQYGFGASGVQTDIYSIGILFQEMLQCLPTFSEHSVAVVSRCTKLDPQDRYPSVAALMADLRPGGPAKAAVSMRYLPPGFRTRNPMHMALAIIGYLIILLMGTQLNVIQGSVPLNRGCFLLISLVTVFFSCNYLGIWHTFRIDRIRSPYGKACAVVAVDAVAAFLLLLGLVILESKPA